MKEAFTKNEIEYRPVVSGNLLAQPFLRDYNMTTKKKVTNAEIIHNQGVYIGNNHFINEKNMSYLAEVVKGIK